MLKDGKIWVGQTEQGENVFLLPKMANRHGLVAGATGTGKTVTLKVLAESFSAAGVPVFMADVKGDITGMMCPGTDSPDMQKRIAKFGLADAGFTYSGCPVTIWDIYGEQGIPLRTTISEIGPMLLARILQLNQLQSDILSIVFKIADDNKLLLIDTKDLKSMLRYVSEHRGDFEGDYGKMSSQSLAAITRAVVALELAGGDRFFGEPSLQITDWLSQENGKGMIHILDSRSLIQNGTMYSTFLLWMISELFETLPEVGDMEKPKMVFFFDEAHLLFDNASKTLLDKLEQVVKLIRSKGVGIYFCTQNPADIPDGVLAQLGNKIQHGLRAYTPADQKAVKAAAASYRPNPAFDTEQTILSLGTGKAVVSFLGEDGVPGMAQSVAILPPQCSMGAAPDAMREQAIKGSLLYSKYASGFDRESAYEVLARQDEAAAKAAAQAAEEAEREKEEEKRLKEEAKQAEREERAKARAVRSVGNSILGSVGRQVGREVGGKVLGSFGRSVGGNVGASIIRGIFGTFFKG
ncbi:MAG: helicase HerA-like domain-containing protein [Succiniclasticum sp.]|jgi:DNA helicase HerA-like ATPase